MHAISVTIQSERPRQKCENQDKPDVERVARGSIATPLIRARVRVRVRVRVRERDQTRERESVRQKEVSLSLSRTSCNPALPWAWADLVEARLGVSEGSS